MGLPCLARAAYVPNMAKSVIEGNEDLAVASLTIFATLFILRLVLVLWVGKKGFSFISGGHGHSHGGHAAASAAAGGGHGHSHGGVPCDGDHGDGDGAEPAPAGHSHGHGHGGKADDKKSK
eukprot:SAG22_NODE_64_length_23238_cov_83.185566_5_plen_121_part_00